VSVWPHGLCYVSRSGAARGQLPPDQRLELRLGPGLKELASGSSAGDDVPLTVWYFGSDPLVTRLPVRYLPLHNAKIEQPDDVEKLVGTGRLAVASRWFTAWCATRQPWKQQVSAGSSPIARTTTFSSDLSAQGSTVK
jgi:hypothetical protein